MFRCIHHILKSNANSYSVSEVRRAVINRYGCGREQNNKLIFSEKDKSSIRRQVKAELNIDPFYTDQLPSNRLAIAKIHPNEKLAKNPVSHDHILINCPNGIVQLNNQPIQLYPESVANAGLMVISSSIKQINHPAIVVVENLAIMQLCCQLKLPGLCQNALWIYRGDSKTGAKVEACYDFLRHFGKDKQVIVFSDMDPKGLEIALTLPHPNYWLGPVKEQWTSCLQSKTANKQGYDLQSESMKYLLNKDNHGELAEPIHDLILQMQAERSSYRQEHMIAHQIDLALFEITQPLRACALKT